MVLYLKYVKTKIKSFKTISFPPTCLRVIPYGCVLHNTILNVDVFFTELGCYHWVGRGEYSVRQHAVAVLYMGDLYLLVHVALNFCIHGCIITDVGVTFSVLRHDLFKSLDANWLVIKHFGIHTCMNLYLELSWFISWIIKIWSYHTRSYWPTLASSNV